jgi:IS30 family transposase
MASGSSIREIASCLHRAASTVSREVARHGGRPAYRAYDADQQAWNAALRPKRCLLAVNSKLRDIVASKLILDWSPEQISGWLKSQYPDDESMRVSHETIYRSLFIQARGALKKELMDHLRSKRRMRRSRHASEQRTVAAGRSSMPSPSATERPAEAEDRAIPGHWEGDLLAGHYCHSNDGAILSDIVEGRIPEIALVTSCCWKRICQVRGRNFSLVPEDTWEELCRFRSYLFARENPRGF